MIGLLAKIGGGIARGAKGTAKIGATGGVAGLASSIFGGGGGGGGGNGGNQQGQGASPLSNFGALGRSAGKKFAGGAANIAAAATTAMVRKVSVSDNTPTKQLWSMMFDMLSSIDASIKNQLNVQKAIATRDSRNDRENTLEGNNQYQGAGVAQVQNGNATGSIGAKTGILGLLAGLAGMAYMGNKFKKPGEETPEKKSSGPSLFDNALGLASGAIVGNEARKAVRNTIKPTLFNPDGSKAELNTKDREILQKKGFTPRGNGFVNSAGKFVSDAEIVKTVALDKGTILATAKRLSGPLSKVAGLSVAFEALEYALTGKKRSSSNLLESAGGILGGILGGIGGAAVGSLGGPVGTVAGGLAGGSGGDWLGRKIAKEIASMLSLQSLATPIDAIKTAGSAALRLPAKLGDMAMDLVRGDPTKVAKGNPVSEKNMKAFARKSGISNKTELDQFMAQVGHESGGFKFKEEVWTNSAAQRSYEGRKGLGNNRKGDGYRYRGRGPMQLTGRYNYSKYGKMIGVDLENNPELAADSEIGQKIAVAYWKDRVRPNISDFRNTKAVTKAINGGYNGLDDRRNRFAKLSGQADIKTASAPAAGNLGIAGSAVSLAQEAVKIASAAQPTPKIKGKAEEVKLAEAVTPVSGAITPTDDRKYQARKAKDWRRKESIINRSEELTKKEEKPQQVVVVQSPAQEQKIAKAETMPRMAKAVPNPSAMQTVLDYQLYFNVRAA